MLDSERSSSLNFIQAVKRPTPSSKPTFGDQPSALRARSILSTLTGTSNDPWGNFRAGFEGKATVNRRDWDLAWNLALDKGGVLVSEKVKLEFDIAAVKRAQ